MKFGPTSLEQALGKILGHNIPGPDGTRILRKGKTLTTENIATLQKISKKIVYVAEFENGDIPENQAAQRIAQAAVGSGLQQTPPGHGSVNATAKTAGLLRVDKKLLISINQVEEIAISTLRDLTVVQPAEQVAKIKIIPFGVLESKIVYIEDKISARGPVISLDPFLHKPVVLLLVGSPLTEDRLRNSFEKSIKIRIEDLGSTLESVAFVGISTPEDESNLDDVLQQIKESNPGLILIAGETAISDRHDIVPQAILRTGGEIRSIGAPVDPGNLLMLAYLGGIPILGLPGCARSPKKNIVDLLLPRILAGIRLSRKDIAALAYGGLIE